MQPLSCCTCSYMVGGLGVGAGILADTMSRDAAMWDRLCAQWLHCQPTSSHSASAYDHASWQLCPRSIRARFPARLLPAFTTRLPAFPTRLLPTHLLPSISNHLYALPSHLPAFPSIPSSLYMLYRIGARPRRRFPTYHPASAAASASAPTDNDTGTDSAPPPPPPGPGVSKPRNNSSH